MVDSTYLKGNALLLGEVKDNTLLYYDYHNKTFMIWNMKSKNDIKNVKIQGLEYDANKIVQVKLCL